MKPITMSDVRLIAGEGKLSADDVLAAVNGHLRMHSCNPAMRERAAPQPCADLTVTELIEWLANPQYTNGVLDFDAVNHMRSAAELLDRLLLPLSPDAGVGMPSSDTPS